MNDTAMVLAITRAKSDLSQPQRVQLIAEQGLEAAWETINAGQQSLFELEPSSIARAGEDLRRWHDSGYQTTSVVDDDYPSSLHTIRESPALIYWQGVLKPDDLGVAVVGSRKASERAKSNARRIVNMVVDKGWTVVSGLAQGIDAAAHAAALEAGGRTVAVMGTGLERTYPLEHAELREQIVSCGGLVMTQFEPGAPVSKRSFPMRNVTMSGYSLATIVVTAGEHSGTRHQARRALLHGRNVILLAPVVEETSWGKTMSSQPGVFVASDLADVKEALTAIHQSRSLLVAS